MGNKQITTVCLCTCARMRVCFCMWLWVPYEKAILCFSLWSYYRDGNGCNVTWLCNPFTHAITNTARTHTPTVVCHVCVCHWTWQAVCVMTSLQRIYVRKNVCVIMFLILCLTLCIINSGDVHWPISALCGCSLVQKHVPLMLIGHFISFVGTAHSQGKLLLSLKCALFRRSVRS